MPKVWKTRSDAQPGDLTIARLRAVRPLACVVTQSEARAIRTNDHQDQAEIRMQTLSEEPNRGRPSRPGVLVRWVRLMVQSRSLFCSVLLGSVLLVGVARAGEVHTGSFTISAE